MRPIPQWGGRSLATRASEGKTCTVLWPFFVVVWFEETLTMKSTSNVWDKSLWEVREKIIWNHRLLHTISFIPCPHRGSVFNFVVTKHGVRHLCAFFHLSYVWEHSPAKLICAFFCIHLLCTYYRANTDCLNYKGAISNKSCSIKFPNILRV